VIIIAENRIKTLARWERLCSIVLCSDGRGCDRVIVINCEGGTFISVRSIKRP